MTILNTSKSAGLTLAAIVSVLGALRCTRPDTNLTTDPGHTPAQFTASAGLDSVLVRSCADCHSNTKSRFTRPPLSWIMARAASEGRKAVNFAEWSTYSAEQQRAYLVTSCADAKSGRMPVGSYLRVRSDAKLSARDVETICAASTTTTASAP